MVPQLPDILGTPGRKTRLAPRYLLDDLPRLAARMHRPAEQLVRVSWRQPRSNSAPGANTNVLSPPTLLDEPSGNGVLNGIPVTVD